jgi:hypothetical protein
MATWTSRPARTPYAAREAPALPEVGMATDLTPSSLRTETVT